MLNHDETLSNDDKDIARRHYSLSPNDSEEVQNVSKQGKYHSAIDQDDSEPLPDHPATDQNDADQEEKVSA